MRGQRVAKYIGAASAGRNHLHPRDDREHQPRRASLGRKVSSRRRCDSAHGDGASQQPRALAATRRTHRRAAALRSGQRRRHARTRSARRAAHAGGEALRFHPCFELVRHDQSGRGALPEGARGRRAHARRCRAERRTHAGRRAGNRLRFPRLLRTQNVCADRHRRALRPRGSSRCDAAVAWRRRNDRQRHPGEEHVQESAAPLRSRHAEHRRRDRPRPRRSITSKRIGRAAIFEHDAQLADYAMERLAELPGMRVLGPAGRARRAWSDSSWTRCIRTT